jgi:hypothetical protein
MDNRTFWISPELEQRLKANAARIVCELRRYHYTKLSRNALSALLRTIVHRRSQ